MNEDFITQVRTLLGETPGLDQAMRATITQLNEEHPGGFVHIQDGTILFRSQDGQDVSGDFSLLAATGDSNMQLLTLSQANPWDEMAIRLSGDDYNIVTRRNI